MASTEEKLLTLLLSVEHLQHTAMEQQKAVADSLAVARETLRGYRDISDGVAKQVRDEVRNEVQNLDVAGLIGERISQDFQRLDEEGEVTVHAFARKNDQTKTWELPVQLPKITGACHIGIVLKDGMKAEMLLGDSGSYTESADFALSEIVGEAGGEA